MIVCSAAMSLKMLIFVIVNLCCLVIAARYLFKCLIVTYCIRIEIETLNLCLNRRVY